MINIVRWCFRYLSLLLEWREEKKDNAICKKNLYSMRKEYNHY